LTSLKSLQPDASALIIILKVKTVFIRSHQVVFEGCFQNIIEGQKMSCLFDEVGYNLWFQGPLNHLGSERQASYIAIILCKILEFLNI
jgi:hypothetical protein